MCYVMELLMYIHIHLGIILYSNTRLFQYTIDSVYAPVHFLPCSRQGQQSGATEVSCRAATEHTMTSSIDPLLSAHSVNAATEHVIHCTVSLILIVVW